MISYNNNKKKKKNYYYGNITTLDRYAVGQNVATTWSFDQESLTKDSPEFKRHIRAWFDEV